MIERAMKRDNKGSTLITVIVAIAFVTILTSIILGTTLVNLRMKGIDRKVKDDFYYAEKGLNDVYTGVGQIAAEYAGDEYNSVFKEIGRTYLTGETAGAKFKEQFLVRIHDKYSTSPNLINDLNKYITDRPALGGEHSVTVTGVGAVKYKEKDGNPADSYDAVKTVGVVIQNVTICATDKYDQQSVITSDIVIDCPTVDFLGTNAEITDYSIIGCQGVYFTDGYTDVTGNLYGGVHDAGNSEDAKIYPTPTPVAAPVYGGINVYSSNVDLKSNYIVSKGDINIAGNKPSLTVGASDATFGIPNMWFDSLRTIKDSTEPSLKLNANLFALNDLELNADKSTVELSGDYYGYNNKTAGPSLDPEKHSIGFSSDRGDSDSSSILINGKGCSLDMSKVHSLVLMGKAYIDFTSKGTVAEGSAKEAPSAESLALQTNQQLYIVPTDFLKIPNPATSANIGEGFKKSFTKTRKELDDWFGYKYVKTDKTWGDTEIVDDIFTEYTVNMNVGGGTETVHYAYLNFNDKVWIKNASNEYEEAPAGTVVGSGGSVSSMAAFFGEIMNSTGDTDTELQPSAHRLREKVKKSITNANHFNLQKCVVNNTGSEVIYANNAVVDYESYTVRDNTDGMERFVGYPQNLFNRYQLLCVYLDGMEKKALGDSITLESAQTNKIKADWRKSTASSPVVSPMDRFVLINGTDNANAKYISGKSIGITSADRLLEGSSSYGACVVDSSCTITAGSTFNGVALVNGNITVEAGAKVNGLLMATGTITVKGGSSGNKTMIKADKGLIQSRVEKEISLIEKGKTDYLDGYLISYLTNDGVNRMYKVSKGGKVEENRISPDYNSFMHYENWRKGN